MRNKGILGLFVAIVIGLTGWWVAGKPGGGEPGIYQDLRQLDENSLKQVRESYFLLHFWAKWCEPCIEEIPMLVEFARQSQEKKLPLKILAVSLDPTLEESKSILPDGGASLPPNFLLALDADHKFAEKIGSFQYPETYLINPKGEIVEKWVGVQKWLQPQVFEFFRQKTL